MTHRAFVLVHDPIHLRHRTSFTLRLLMVLVGLSATTAAFGGIAFSIPANSAHSMPTYFSGTNARISAHAHLTTGTLAMTEAILLVGGQETYHGYRPYDPLVPAPASWNVYIMFDSTQFLSPAGLSIEFRVKDQAGGWHSSQSSAPNKNKGVFYEHPDPAFSPDAAPIAASLGGAMGYQTALHNGTLWTALGYFSESAGANCGYVVSHGDPNYHQSGDLDPIFHGGAGGLYNYENSRQAIIGTGPKPPYNSTGNPLTNFLHIYACNVGDTNSFIRACWPYENWYAQKWLENQAFLAYSCYVPTNQAVDHASEVWGQLAVGWTIATVTTSISVRLGYPPGDPDRLDWNAWDVYPGTIRHMAAGDIALYGDGTMRLKSVYTGTHFAPSGWWRLNP